MSSGPRGPRRRPRRRRRRGSAGTGRAVPGTGTTPGDIRTRPRDDVEEPVALAELEGRLEDRPVEVGRGDERLGLRLRARVVESRVVHDAHRAHVDEPADACSLHRRDDRPRPLGVDEAEVGAAAEVTRDRREVDDRIDAGHRPSERVRARSRHPPDLDPARPRARPGEDASLASDVLEGDDAVPGREQCRHACGCRRSRSRP